jgi:hypothetical protein
MSLLNALNATLFSLNNVKRERTVIVTTAAGAFEGEYLDASNGVLTLGVYAINADSTNGPTGNTLLIPESEIRMIEIDWKDTYGLVNGEPEAVAAYETARGAALASKQED